MSAASDKRRDDRIAGLNSIIGMLQDSQKLSSWTEFTEAFAVPADMLPAIASGRLELLQLVQQRAMNEGEVALLLHFIGVLLQTNEQLRQHAQQTAHLVNLWTDSFKQLRSTGDRIEAFANFRQIDTDG